LNDYQEIMVYDTDPRSPDTNQDGLADYLEVKDADGNDLVIDDIDGDGVANALDFDNDNDGVNDGADLSPLTIRPHGRSLSVSRQTDTAVSLLHSSYGRKTRRT
jgi:hypothetical protein